MLGKKIKFICNTFSYLPSSQAKIIWNSKYVIPYVNFTPLYMYI
jgi:hypothetical protein